ERRRRRPPVRGAKAAEWLSRRSTSSMASTSSMPGSSARPRSCATCSPAGSPPRERAACSSSTGTALTSATASWRCAGPRTLTRRQGRDLAGEGVSVVATGGAQAVGRVVADLRSTAASIAGLCDAGEEALFRRAGFGSTLYVCHADLEDELIRALGTDAVEGI